MDAGLIQQSKETMSDDCEKDLAQVLRETPWDAILAPLAVGLLVVLLTLAAVVVED